MMHSNTMTFYRDRPLKLGQMAHFPVPRAAVPVNDIFILSFRK